MACRLVFPHTKSTEVVFGLTAVNTGAKVAPLYATVTGADAGPVPSVLYAATVNV